MTSVAKKKRKASVQRRRQFVIFGAIIASVAILLLGVFPTRTFLEQRQELRNTEKQLALLEKTNQQLRDRANQLNQDGELERLAREKYNMVRPGEKAFGILPSPQQKTSQPEDQPVQEEKAWWEKTLDFLEFWN